MPESRAELERVLAAPSSEISSAWIGDVIRAFTATSGGPFTEAEIEQIREIERDRTQTFAAVTEAVELVEKLQQAKRRCALLEDAVNRGVMLEELALEYAVPGGSRLTCCDRLNKALVTHPNG